MVRHRGAVPPGSGPQPGRAPLPLLGRRPPRPVPSWRRRYARAGQRSAAGPSRRSGAGRRARRRWGTARAPLCGRAAPGQRARRCLVPAGPLGAGGPGEPASAFPVRPGAGRPGVGAARQRLGPSERTGRLQAADGSAAGGLETCCLPSVCSICLGWEE